MKELCTNSEIFKLLQLFDCSKSPSDLELREITTQQQRKVRRNTRPRPNIHRHNDYTNSDNQCNRLIIWIAIFLISCWLLMLSYMLAIIHNESNRIEEQIRTVALASQNVPDALQKWHETSKNLEQNQTLLAGTLLDIQKYIEDIKNRLAIYETKLNEKKDYQKDEKIVADIGAEIKAVSADVTDMESKFANLQKSQTDFRTEIDTIKANFNETVTNATRCANNNETSFADELNKVQTTIYNEIKMLAANVSLINDKLSQKTDMISKDATAQQRDIGDLQIRSIEHNNWKSIVAEDFGTFKNYLNYELPSLQNATKDLKNNIEDVRKVCKRIEHDILQSFSNNETRESQTVKKEMSRDKSPLMAAHSDNTRKTAASTASNASSASEPSGKVKTLSETTPTDDSAEFSEAQIVALHTILG